jgi:Recombination endonuclease VII
VTAEPVCWGWPLELPSEEDARRIFFERLKYPDLTPGQADVLWSLERAASGLGGESILADWQAGRCAVCGRVRDLVLDHDHATGLVRGWLCNSCNTTEGTNQEPGTIFSLYRERYPAAILGLTIRYLNPVTGEYATPQLPREVDWVDKWTDAASEDIGL